MQKSIVLLYTYFGPLPWYFPYFVKSCFFNPTIKFKIITDNKISLELPPNVTIVKKSLNEVIQIANEKLGFTVNINSYYKLCDFKPTYGFLFPDLIEGYDYWGFGDIDVIFGDVRNFMTYEILDEYDLICLRHDFLTGYFTLMRNCKAMNNLFKESKDYKRVLSESRHYCFDETNFEWESFAEGLHFSQIQSDIESMTHVVKKMHEMKLINAHFDFCVIEGTPGRIKWDKGRLIYKNRYEAILYHLVRLKTIYKPQKQISKVPDNFSISSTRIY